MTIETEDVVAFIARLRTYQWGIEQDTLNQAADLIQSLSERIAVLRDALDYAKDYLRGECNVGAVAQIQAIEARASLTKAD